MNISIKEKIIQNKGKIIAAAVVVGVIGVGIATKGKLTGGKIVSIPAPMKNLAIPTGVLGQWDAFWMERQFGKTYFNAIVNDVRVEDLGAFGETLLKAGYTDGEVGFVVGQCMSK